MGTLAAREARPAARAGRFAALLAADPCHRAQFDHILLDVEGCVVAPTLGSIVPYWLLVVPRDTFINFRDWSTATGMRPHQVIADVLTKLHADSDRAIWFEHGAANAGSLIGCGVDHAHLHVIADPPFVFDDLANAVMRAAPVTWSVTSSANSFSALRADSSYLIAGSGGQAIIAERVELVGSQFFRRVIADLLGVPDSWDYKAHPHMENIRESIRAFSGRRASDAFR